MIHWGYIAETQAAKSGGLAAVLSALKTLTRVMNGQGRSEFTGWLVNRIALVCPH